MPKWMGALDGITPPKAAGLAVLLGTVNPKNLVLSSSVPWPRSPRRAISGRDQAVAWIVFTLIATIGVAIPLVIYFAMGDRARRPNGIKVWMSRNNAAMMAVLCLIVGVKLVGDAITGFST